VKRKSFIGSEYRKTISRRDCERSEQQRAVSLAGERVCELSLLFLV
jgi:hypothetical protein